MKMSACAFNNNINTPVFNSTYAKAFAFLLVMDNFSIVDGDIWSYGKSNSIWNMEWRIYSAYCICHSSNSNDCSDQHAKNKKTSSNI